MALIAPQTVLPDLLSHRRRRTSCSTHESVKHTLRSSSFLASSTPSLRRQHSLQCAAVTGGSKRDVEKLVAKTQHRRSRHKKGVSPSKPALMEELEEEEVTEEDMPKEIAQLVNGDSKNRFSEGSYNESLQVEDRLNSNAQAESTLQGRGNQDSEDSSMSNVVNDAPEGVKEVLETTEDTATDVVDKAASTQKQVVSDAVKGVESLVGSDTDAVNEQSRISSSSSEGSEDELSHDIGNSVRALADVTADTASDVGTRINETGQQVQQDVAEVASNVGDNSKSQINNAFDNFNEQVSEVQDSERAVADVAKDTSSYVNKKIGETGEQLGQDLSEVGSTGQRILQNSSNVMSAQTKDFISQAEKVLDEEGNLLKQGVSRIERKANESLGRAQDSIQKAVQESAQAARDLGMEALGMGELLVDTAEETIRGTSAIVQDKGTRVNARREEKGDELLTEDSKPQTSQQEERNCFTGFKVLVAGASGQTGRLVIENLVSKGASVQALVRDVYKARSISQLKDCECVEADLYNYEAVRTAIGDCNVVICAIGARGLPFDPFNTYQVEYEGVLNLISAAKNQGNVKKFVLISTIGVTYLQLVPLIFWKKQAELYLQRSGLDYTIVRPGGLRNTSGPEDVVMQGADSQFFGGISRKKVAEVCVSALVSLDASHKIVEVVSVPGSQKRSIVDLFKQV